MTEEWKDIEGFEGLYQISNFGNVRSVDHMTLKGNSLVNYLGMPMKLQKSQKGHLKITLAKGSRKSTRSVAKLVAYHFLDGFKENAVSRNVKFKDGDKTNCRVDNLM